MKLRQTVLILLTALAVILIPAAMVRAESKTFTFQENNGSLEMSYEGSFYLEGIERNYDYQGIRYDSFSVGDTWRTKLGCLRQVTHHGSGATSSADIPMPSGYTVHTVKVLNEKGVEDNSLMSVTRNENVLTITAKKAGKATLSVTYEVKETYEGHSIYVPLFTSELTYTIKPSAGLTVSMSGSDQVKVSWKPVSGAVYYSLVPFIRCDDGPMCNAVGGLYHETGNSAVFKISDFASSYEQISADDSPTPVYQQKIVPTASGHVYELIVLLCSWDNSGLLTPMGQSMQSLTYAADGGIYTDTATQARYELNTKKKTASLVGLGASRTSLKMPASVKIGGISYKVTSVAAKALKGHTRIKELTIGSNVTSIGKNAFQNCTEMVSAVIGSKVKSIGVSAFQGCKKLKTITIKSTKLTAGKVGSKAFKGTPSKAEIKVPKKVKSAYKKWLVKKGFSKKAKIQ